MVKILVAVLGLGFMLGAAYYSLANPRGSSQGTSGASQPKRQLDNVRRAAGHIEKDEQDRADEAMRHSQAAEAQ